MSSLLQSGAAWLAAKLGAHAGISVTYQRGAAEATVTATIGRTEFEQADEYGVVHVTESRDFLIAAADLVLDGSRVLPQAGDRIRETEDGQVHVYEVLAPGGEPSWRYSDAFRQRLRIHTKHVAMEDTP